MQVEPTPAVYVIQAEHGGPVKIGYCASTVGVINRLAGLQTGNPYRLVVRRVIPAPRGRVHEAEMHEQLAEFRMSGEWFMHTADVAIALSLPLPATDEDGRRFRPLIENAFNAGMAHGRKQAERETRDNLRELFQVALPWMLGLDEPEIEVSTIEEALRAVAGYRTTAHEPPTTTTENSVSAGQNAGN